MPVCHAEHFAAKVAERRRGLGLTIVGLSHNGGPTAPTVTKAEAGTLVDPRPSTLTKFDTGLRWAPGSSAQAYWEGADPRPQEAADPPVSARVLEPGAATVALPHDVVLELMTAQGRLNELLDTAAATVPTSQLVGVAEILNRSVNFLVGRFVTDLLERNHATDGRPLQPLIEVAFAELLAPPVDVADPQREEKLYRRWLLGRAPDLPEHLVDSFQRRLHS